MRGYVFTKVNKKKENLNMYHIITVPLKSSQVIVIDYYLT